MLAQDIEQRAVGVRLVDSRSMKGFFYHEATDRQSWNAMIELFNETLK